MQISSVTSSILHRPRDTVDVFRILGLGCDSRDECLILIASEASQFNNSELTDGWTDGTFIYVFISHFVLFCFWFKFRFRFWFEKGFLPLVIFKV